MKVHLLRDGHYDKDEFTNVVEFLTSFEGPIIFLANDPDNEEDIEVMVEKVQPKRFYTRHLLAENSIVSVRVPRTREVATWRNIFSQCQRYRLLKKVPADEMIILLTPFANENNWFSAADPTNNLNCFVHANEWPHYVSCNAEFPVAYLVASLILEVTMFDTMEQLMKHIHHNTLGCFNDLCEHKKDILLKLRTADICYDCMNILKDKASPFLVKQVLDIFEGVRKRILFVQNFHRTLQPTRLLIKKHRLFLTDYGNLEIKLTPLEKTLYLLFLNHSDGIVLKHLPDYKDELRKIYCELATTGILAEINNRINAMVDVRTNSVSEKLSKIKQKFVEAVGEDLAVHYYIQGIDGGRKSIPLSRELVSII